jgi:hypothetical protein
MNKITKILLVTVGFSVLTIILGSLTSRPAPAQTGSTRVTVVNPNNQPVPTLAQGITPVTGSVAALQGGPFRVHAINALDANSNPVPLIVQDANSAGRYPFSLSVNNQGSVSDPTSTHGGGSVILPPSPTNGTAVAVIEFVSTICLVPPNVAGPGMLDIVSLSTTLGSSTNFSTFFLTALTQSVENTTFGGEVWATYETKIYANAGSSVNVGLPGNNNGCFLSVSGYLLPQ